MPETLLAQQVPGPLPRREQVSVQAVAPHLLFQHNAHPVPQPTASRVPSSLLLGHHRHPGQVPRAFPGSPTLLRPDGLVEPAALSVGCHSTLETAKVPAPILYGNCSSCKHAPPQLASVQAGPQ